jgi:hypothetical protein
MTIKPEFRRPGKKAVPETSVEATSCNRNDDREVDAFIAAKLNDWINVKRFAGVWWGSGPYYRKKFPDSLTMSRIPHNVDDIERAWAVAEKYGLKKLIKIGKIWRADFPNCGIEYDKDAAKAIHLAALKSVGVVISGTPEAVKAAGVETHAPSPQEPR